MDSILIVFGYQNYLDYNKIWLFSIHHPYTTTLTACNERFNTEIVGYVRVYVIPWLNVSFGLENAFLQ